MLKKIPFILMMVLMLMALAPRKGYMNMPAGTSDNDRSFRGSVANLTVSPLTADVLVLHYPHYADQDSFTVKAGDVMNWDGLDIYGFKIIRTVSTAVDVYWW